ncbi:methionine biosynthesis protein MetW [Ancylobacter pratisalsi]|uniref:Methionine biosynthesis protein MetW n=2 Tax=Ancylobacter pratisalsi TaxID=1745854 RepID=A0A6P1YL39_9HYPH|nr:methionine biosynthesis protein MetW [Ancylobacter pratisalsi]
MSLSDPTAKKPPVRDLTMSEAARTDTGARVDLLVIAEMVEPATRVLDVGCGDGVLLELLATTRGCDARGIELSREGVNASVSRGLAVIQGDADIDLADYPDNSFDYVILSQTIQATRRPKWVLEQMLRVGSHAVVSFPNFGFWRMRLELLMKGRMPRTENLPYSWHDTPNIHFCTIRDFVGLVDEVGAQIDQAVALNGYGQKVRFNWPWSVWNLVGEQAVFLLSRKG